MSVEVKGLHVPPHPAEFGSVCRGNQVVVGDGGGGN